MIIDVEIITVAKNLLSATHYNYTSSKTHMGDEATPYVLKDFYYPTIAIEPTKTITNTVSRNLVATSTTPRPEYEIITEDPSSGNNKLMLSSNYMYAQSPSIYRLTTVHAFQVLYPITRSSEIGANTISDSTLSSLSTTTTTAHSSVTSISETTDKPQAGAVTTMAEYQTIITKKQYYLTTDSVLTTVNLDSLSTTVPSHSTPFIGSAEMTISRGLHVQSIKTAKSTVNRDTSLVSMLSQYSTMTLESEERTTVTAGSLTGTEQGLISIGYTLRCRSLRDLHYRGL